MAPGRCDTMDLYMSALALQATNSSLEKAGAAKRPANQSAVVELPVDQVKVAAARLYGRGYKRAQVQQILLDHLVPGHPKDREKEARRKLRLWEKDKEFHDLIWQESVSELDLHLPEVMQGIFNKAKRGRVDAARLALEVTGRHNPRGDGNPTQVIVQIGAVPRPAQRYDLEAEPSEEIDGPE